MWLPCFSSISTNNPIAALDSLCECQPPRRLDMGPGPCLVTAVVLVRLGERVNRLAPLGRDHEPRLHVLVPLAR